MTGRHSIPRAQRLWTRFLWWAWLAGLAALLVPLLGGLHWRFDLIAHFRIQAFWGAVLLLALALASRRFQVALGAAALMAYAGAGLLPFWIAPQGPAQNPDGPKLKVIVSNVLTHNGEREPLLAWVREQQPDVFAVIELGQAWKTDLDQALEQWPYRAARPAEDNFGIGVYSRLPLESVEWKQYVGSGPLDGPLSGLVTVRWQERAIPILITHPFPPVAKWADEMRDAQLERLFADPFLKAPKALLVGDFNTTSWSKSMRTFPSDHLRDARHGFGLAPTWPTYFPEPLRIPIDTIFTGPAWHVLHFERGPDIGSDHFPLLVTLSPSTQWKPKLPSAALPLPGSF